MPRVTRDITIDAPVETVWEHVADRHRRAGWFGGDLDVDLEPGQRGTFVTPDGEQPVRVDEVNPGRTLRFTWGHGAGSTVTIELTPEGEASRVRVTETVDADHESEGGGSEHQTAGARSADPGAEAGTALLPGAARARQAQGEVVDLRRPTTWTSTSAWERAAA